MPRLSAFLCRAERGLVSIVMKLLAWVLERLALQSSPRRG
jgi:hypothetical protein